jgi:hypothetical protein
MADPYYALQKWSEAVDALATGAGRVQDWLGVNRRSVCLMFVPTTFPRTSVVS